MSEYAMLLPPVMQDDNLTLRHVLTEEAERAGCVVAAGAAIHTDVVTDRFDPDVRALHARIEVS